ncbi:DUF5916 domain-containing protein [Lacimicrobium alkaliphilum]|uniref:DUF5916 domain-containing protein n=1 Tax=Lacimicrobium alkaliphilum TaxID=1526571 RepID=A0A0U3B6L0_9ALTE|nr:DUF5916 domain-containing protein [Lacimicrobium alkaliphilum]ALS97285.1 hypothetical protein AT746_02695 [Lacimicrobium alkaliphilum]
MKASISVVTMFLVSPAFAIQIDGKLDEPAWQQAIVYDEFVQTLPNTGTPPAVKTRAMLITSEDGIYIGIVNQQEERSRRYSSHDQHTSADFNIVYLDFAGSGSTAYEFVATLGGGTMDGTYTRGNESNRDWDGLWSVAVSEDKDAWYSEFFIPWSVATFRSSADAATRNMAVSFMRYNIAAQEIYFFPDTSRVLSTFTYDFQPFDAQIAQSGSWAVTPYFSGTWQVDDGEQDNNLGLDLVYKPNSAHQFLLTLNPDFGQVESDELVVNYTNIETLRSDKRPFFAENQSLFDVRGPGNLKLFHTRRIGGASSDGLGVQEISLAAKSIHSLASADVGVFYAREKDMQHSAGSSFLAGRWLRSDDDWSLGQLATFVDVPQMSRKAAMSNLDFNYRVSEQTTIFANILASRVEDQHNVTMGRAATLSASLRPSRIWNNQLDFSYFSDQLELNDLGYLPRNDLVRARYTGEYSLVDFPSDSTFRRIYLKGIAEYSQNTGGDVLPSVHSAVMRLDLKNRYSWIGVAERRSSGIDDLIAADHGKVAMPAQHWFKMQLVSPTSDLYSYDVAGIVYQEGLDEWARRADINTKWFVTDNIRVELNFQHIDSDDWFIGRGAGTVNRYSRTLQKWGLNLNSRLSTNSDISWKIEWYGLKATGQEGYQVSALDLIPRAERPEDILRSALSMQVRYRYKLAPLSDLYLVYARSGSEVGAGLNVSHTELMRRTWQAPKENYLLLKLNYRL